MSSSNKMELILYSFLRTIPAILLENKLMLHNRSIEFIIISPFLVWSICALFAAKQGEYIELYYYPFFLLYPIIYIVRDFKKILQNTNKYIEQRRLLITIIMMIFFGGVVLAMIFVVIQINTKNNILIKIINVIVTVSSFVSLLGLLIVIVNIFKIIIVKQYQFFSDWRRWKKWNKIKPPKIEIEALLTKLSNYHQEEFWMKLISLVRKENLLKTNQKSEMTLEQLALTIEKYVYHKETILSEKGNLSEKINLIISPEVTYLNMWLKKNGELKTLKKLENNLDEIYLLLEQVRSLRQVNAIQN